MSLAEKYTTKNTIDIKDGIESTKVILSNDAFAVCEFIEMLIKKIEQLRISGLGRK